LLEQVSAFPGPERFDQMLLGRRQNALSPRNVDATIEVHHESFSQCDSLVQVLTKLARGEVRCGQFSPKAY